MRKSVRRSAQSCPTLCDPMDCNPPGSSVHGIFQAKILEWVAISFSRESSWPRDWTRVSRVVGKCFTIWATGEVKKAGKGDDRRWDGWMAWLTQWTWVWASCGSWWLTGKPGVCCSPWECKELDSTERLNWTELNWAYSPLSQTSLKII